MLTCLFDVSVLSVTEQTGFEYINKLRGITMNTSYVQLHVMKLTFIKS